jgi:hypothetical protein
MDIDAMVAQHARLKRYMPMLEDMYNQWQGFNEARERRRALREAQTEQSRPTRQATDEDSRARQVLYHAQRIRRLVAPKS